MPPLEQLDREQLHKLDKETLINLLLVALQRIDDFEKQVAGQVVTIQKLQDQLAKDSHNSSKPPSSESVFQKYWLELMVGLPLSLLRSAGKPFFMAQSGCHG